MGGKVGENPAALRAAVFSLSSKNLRGGRSNAPPPAGRGLIEPIIIILNNIIIIGREVYPAECAALGVPEYSMSSPCIIGYHRPLSLTFEYVWVQKTAENDLSGISWNPCDVWAAVYDILCLHDCSPSVYLFQLQIKKVLDRARFYVHYLGFKSVYNEWIASELIHSVMDVRGKIPKRRLQVRLAANFAHFYEVIPW